MSELYFIEASLQLSPYSTPPPFFFHSTGKYPGDLSLVFHDIDPSDSRTSSIFVKFQVLFTDQRYLDTVSFTKHLRKDGVKDSVFIKLKMQFLTMNRMECWFLPCYPFRGRRGLKISIFIPKLKLKFRLKFKLEL